MFISDFLKELGRCSVRARRDCFCVGCRLALNESKKLHLYQAETDLSFLLVSSLSLLVDCVFDESLALTLLLICVYLAKSSWLDLRRRAAK